MKAVLQRVKSASVMINGQELREIGEGLLVFLGVSQSDTQEICDKVINKCINLRIFEDENNKLNLSISDIKGEMLIVSNFTLCANTINGRRPSFKQSAKLPLSKSLYERFIYVAKQSDLLVKAGEFGANMQVSLVNDGPVTIVIDTNEWSM